MSLFNSAPQPFEPARERDVNPKTAQSALLKTAGIVMMIVSPIIGLLLCFVAPLIGAFVWMGCTSLAAMLLKRAKRLKAQGATYILSHDPRPPVLYLRSFQADEKTAEAVGSSLSIKGVDFTLPTTEEEQIEKSVKRIGPLVAIGRPNEALPMLGAARMYVADDQWQARVLDLMARSSLVLMRAGKTEGYWWEVEMAVKHVRPENLIWLIPFSKENYTAFAQRANQFLPKPIPTEPPSGSTVGSIRGWISFDPDWTPHLQTPAIGDASHQGAPVAALMHRILGPVYCRMGHIQESLRCSVWRRFLALLVDYLVIAPFFLLAILLGDRYPAVGAFGLWMVALWVVYLVVLDLPGMGGTLGKRLTKLKVVNRDGVEPTMGQALVRGLTKAVAVVIFPFTFLFGVFAISRSIQRRMPQDLVSRTYVVDPQKA